MGHPQTPAGPTAPAGSSTGSHRSGIWWMMLWFMTPPPRCHPAPRSHATISPLLFPGSSGVISQGFSPNHRCAGGFPTSSQRRRAVVWFCLPSKRPPSAGLGTGQPWNHETAHKEAGNPLSPSGTSLPNAAGARTRAGGKSHSSSGSALGGLCLHLPPLRGDTAGA